MQSSAERTGAELMINVPRIAATRINLLASRRRLAQVRRGGALLRRKREALVRELFRLARPAAGAREQIAAELVNAYEELLEALAQHGRAGLRAIAWPARDLELRIESAHLWGISVSDIVSRPTLRRMLDARAVAPGSVGTTTSDVAGRFERITELLLDAAAAEERLRRIADAIAKDTRHLRALEQRLAPQLESQMAHIQATLQEREREEYLRLKHLQEHRSAR